MAYELQPFGIKVAIIEPGVINTNFKSTSSEGIIRRYLLL